MAISFIEARNQFLKTDIFYACANAKIGQLFFMTDSVEYKSVDDDWKSVEHNFAKTNLSASFKDIVFILYRNAKIIKPDYVPLPLISRSQRIDMYDVWNKLRDDATVLSELKNGKTTQFSVIELVLNAINNNRFELKSNWTGFKLLDSQVQIKLAQLVFDKPFYG
jgi:hypothetical protein